MIMTRTIHPVGQGAFYTECFEDNNVIYNVVYDCGSETSCSSGGRLIDKEIMQTFKKGDEILALFISHFHSDHINGIKTLLTQCKVKYVILPIIDNITKLILLASDDNKDLQDFVLSPTNYIKNISQDTTIISVKPYNRDEEDRPDEAFDLSQGYDNEMSIKSGTTLIINSENFVWKYIPFNYNNEQIIKDIEKAYQDKRHSVPDADSINLSELNFAKKVYKDILRTNPKINAHSMILYSGACTSFDWRCKAIFNSFCGHICCGCGCFDPTITTGCIYFGDFDLNSNVALSSIAANYEQEDAINNISIMQVPHHGSIHNFNEGIFLYLPRLRFAFISAGEKNKYRHPSATVVKNILKSECRLKLVTENKSSMLQIIYEGK